MGAAPTAPHPDTAQRQLIRAAVFPCFILYNNKKEESGRAETDDRRSYGLLLFLFYIIRKKKAAAHLCGAHARHADAYT